jgi:hypothetical protein
MGNSYFSVNYENIFLVITELVIQGINKKLKFSSLDKKLIYSFKFYDRVLKKLTSVTALANLINMMRVFS